MSSTQCCSCSRPKCSDFGLGGVSPTVFVKTQCPMHIAIFLVYRIVVILYLLGYFLFNFIISVRPGGPFGGYYFIYLTNWGYILMLVYMFCALWNLIMFAAFMRNADRSLQNGVPSYFFQHGQWLLFNMYASAAVLITLLYWGALYQPGVVSLYYDINFHLLNGLFVLVEIFLTATVVRILHFIYPFTFAIVYVIFTVIYWAAGGTDEMGNPYVYPILDYGNKPELSAGLCVGALVGVIIVHIVIVWGLHKLKVLIFSKCCPSCVPEEAEEIEMESAENDPQNEHMIENKAELAV